MAKKAKPVLLRSLNTPLQRWLKAHAACATARRWVGTQTFGQAWRRCKRADWLDWVTGEVMGWRASDACATRAGLDGVPFDEVYQPRRLQMNEPYNTALLREFRKRFDWREIWARIKEEGGAQ